jgi:hypothetical protein
MLNVFMEIRIKILTLIQNGDSRLSVIKGTVSRDGFGVDDMYG